MTAPFRDGQPGDAQAFYVGQLVDVKGRGRATVLETAEPGGAAGPATAGAAAAAPPAAAGQPPYLFAGRVHVRFHEDSTTYWVNPSHLRCMRPASARIVVAYRTELYRAAITHNVEFGCCCLEVGSHTGTTTALLHRRSGGRAVGVDNVELMVQGARQRFPGVRFELADGAGLATLRALSPNNPGFASGSGTSGSPHTPPASGSSSSGVRASSSCEAGSELAAAAGGSSRSSSGSSGSSSAATGDQGLYDVICVDLSGKAPLRVVVPLLEAHMREWPAAQLIVKNEALFCAVEAWQQQRHGGGSGGSAGGQDAPEEQQQGQQQQAAAEGAATQERRQHHQQQQPEQDAALLAQLLAGWRLDGGGGSSSPTDPAAARQLAAVLRECELFRSEGFLSQTDKPLNKAKDRRCRYCGQGGIGKWKEHNRQCAAKQAAKAAKKEAKAAVAAAEAVGG